MELVFYSFTLKISTSLVCPTSLLWTQINQWIGPKPTTSQHHQPANLLVAGIQLYRLLLFRAEVYLGDRLHGLGLPDTKGVTHKGITSIREVVGSTGSHCKEYREVDSRSELGVAEDSTPGKSCLYKATPTLIM